MPRESTIIFKTKKMQSAIHRTLLTRFSGIESTGGLQKLLNFKSHHHTCINIQSPKETTKWFF